MAAMNLDSNVTIRQESFPTIDKDMSSGEARQQIALLKMKLAYMQEAAKAQKSIGQISGKAAGAMM